MGEKNEKKKKFRKKNFFSPMSGMERRHAKNQPYNVETVNGFERLRWCCVSNAAVITELVRPFELFPKSWCKNRLVLLLELLSCSSVSASNRFCLAYVHADVEELSGFTDERSCCVCTSFAVSK